MNTQSLNTVRKTLIRRGLPANYVRRVVGELEDHQLDIAGETAVTDETTTTDSDRLGDFDQLAATLAERYQARTFAGRHPVVTFLLAPIPAVLMAWAAMLMVLFGVVQLYEIWFELSGKTISDLSSSVVGMALVMYVAEIVVPPAVIAMFFSWLAYRGGKGMIWSCAATLLVAFAALCFNSGLAFPVTPGTGTFFVGFGFSSGMFFGPQLLQMLVPILAVMLLVLPWERKRRTLSAT